MSLHFKENGGLQNKSEQNNYLHNEKINYLNPRLLQNSFKYSLNIFLLTII